MMWVRVFFDVLWSYVHDARIYAGRALCRAGLHKWSNHAIFGIIRWCRRCGHRK